LEQVLARIAQIEQGWQPLSDELGYLVQVRIDGCKRIVERLQAIMREVEEPRVGEQ
jgi:hypothetical protein